MKRIFSFLLGIMLCMMIHAQFPYGTTGLLHMPTADMQRDKTFMLGGSFLHEGATPEAWSYNTYNYYINITIFPFLEVGYACTLFKGVEGNAWPKSTWGKFVNQDRQFSGRLRLLKEGQFWKYMPAVVVGGNDVFTSASGEEASNLTQVGNGHWNRWYFAATKHANLYGELGIHAAYVYNRRKNYRLNGLAMGANWKPQFHSNLNLMAEYDSRTVNCGLGYTFWKDHINLVTELNDFKYLSVGVCFKVHLK
ncbi:YjbH domain-containing protein [Bacteroides ihuae]|uniref:YjbH domain-containing protein n=1 Tax=Bacteroides ihuae TaxID=1852362 RepID=UPI0008DB2217|nr:YjbH domain-containing protein [Bacteroides ihuae]